MPASNPTSPPLGNRPATLASASVVDAAWRAMLYCLHPRVIWLSLLPVILPMVCLGLLAWWGWDGAVAQMRAWLDTWSLSQTLLGWLDGLGATGFRAVLAPLLVVIVSVPVVVVICLLVVATMMTPAIVKLVAQRRFPALEERRGGRWWASLGWSFGATIVALLALFVSLPLWLIPPFALVLPPVIWGWLTYRVMAYDTLADHASVKERQQLLKERRSALLAIGVITGYLGAAPAALWALSAFTIIFAPVLVVVSVWLYTLVFAFSSLWFAHYLLAALQIHRASEARAVPVSELRPADAMPRAPEHAPDTTVIDVPAREVPNASGGFTPLPPQSSHPGSP
ncbi:MAG TPA: EI24 domain-containing protein [Candidatus Aquabacterium excrementipullorum]|nr:EI24 domain-containing protein [Candidatus Aquabacterium excrementipullorum]